MAWEKIADLLAGKVSLGDEVTVKGWVRTRRDSKAGLSFVQVHDGTCFAALQVVAPGASEPEPEPEPESEDVQPSFWDDAEVDDQLEPTDRTPMLKRAFRVVRDD